MVKHPKYQAMDDGRQTEIPRAFEEFSDKHFRMEKVPPKIPDDPLPGPIPRPHFRVYREEDGALAAVFYPNGHSECMDDSFKEIYDRMVKSIAHAAKRAREEYEGH